MEKYGGGAVAFFRNFFAPTEENGMMPFGLGRTAFLLYLALAATLILAPVYVRIRNLADLSTPTLTNFDAATVISLVNEARAGAGMNPLAESAKLDKAADDKVFNMLTNQYFAHVSPSGVTPWDFFRFEGYDFVAAGENLAKDFTSAADAQAAFMNSPTHRDNILSPLYTEIGAAVEAGTFDGRSTILVAQYFGTQKAIAPLARQAPPPVAAQIAENTPKKAPLAASDTAVLGTEIQPAPQAAPAAASASPGVAAPVAVKIPSVAAATPLTSIVATSQNGIKAIAIIALFFILLASAFLIMRGSASPVVVLRTIFLLLLFGYVAVLGAGMAPISRITPNSASIIIVTQ